MKKFANIFGEPRVGMTWGFAFTLAEVIITLGIIGIVAALTMPALITNYQNRVFETSKTVFETRMGQALQQMNIAEELTGYTETEQFVDALKKYMKIIKVCEPGKLTSCFIDRVNSAAGVPIDVDGVNFVGAPSDWDTDVYGIVLQNGHSALLKYNPNCQSPGISAKASELKSCIAVAYDTNGKSLPNAQNKDINGDALSVRMVIVGTGSSAFKMTEADIPYAHVDSGPLAWASAKETCEKLGLRLPSNGIGNSTTEGYCPGGATTTNNAKFKGSEACQINDWCKKSGNTCGKWYWLAELNSTDPDHPYVLSVTATTSPLTVTVSTSNPYAGLNVKVTSSPSFTQTWPAREDGLMLPFAPDDAIM